MVSCTYAQGFLLFNVPFTSAEEWRWQWSSWKNVVENGVAPFAWHVCCSNVLSATFNKARPATFKKMIDLEGQKDVRFQHLYHVCPGREEKRWTVKSGQTSKFWWRECFMTFIIYMYNEILIIIIIIIKMNNFINFYTHTTWRDDRVRFTMFSNKSK